MSRLPVVECLVAILNRRKQCSKYIRPKEDIESANWLYSEWCRRRSILESALLYVWRTSSWLKCCRPLLAMTVMGWRSWSSTRRSTIQSVLRRHGWCCVKTTLLIVRKPLRPRSSLPMDRLWGQLSSSAALRLHFALNLLSCISCRVVQAIEPCGQGFAEFRCEDPPLPRNYYRSLFYHILHFLKIWSRITNNA